jgi:hypothetical protein
MSPLSEVRGKPIAIRFSLVAATCFLIPAVLFYSMLFSNIVNLPMFDDYPALLNFLNDLTEIPTLPTKAYYFLVSQHHEYKLFFEHALFWTQLNLLGRINLALLCILGDSFIGPLAIVLWKMFLPHHSDKASRLILFIPIPWLLFQLQYAQTLNFAMGGLQNLPVLVFSLAAIYLLLRMTRWTLAAAVVCLVLSVSSSANGLLMIPIGMLILAFRRNYARLSIWALMSGICIAAYFYGYKSTLWLVPSESVIPPLAQFWRPVYVICFLGSAAGYPTKYGSFAFGLMMCVFYAYIAKRGYYSRNSMVGWSVLFLMLTAVGVAGLRSELGIIYSISSRYTIYSILLVIFAWFVIVEEWLIHKRRSPQYNRVFQGVVVGAVLFSLAMDVRGLRFLTRRNRDLVTGMILYERHPTQPTVGPIFPQPRSRDGQEFNLKARDILAKSAKLGIYQPPVY